MRISDWSSDVCSSDLDHSLHADPGGVACDHVHASCAESAKAYLVARQDTARLFHQPFQIIDPDGAIRNGTDHVRSQHMRNGFILTPQHRIGEARCYTSEFECLLEMDVHRRVQPIYYA